MDKLGLKRYCCRRMMLTHVDLIEKLLRYGTQIWVKFAKILRRNAQVQPERATRCEVVEAFTHDHTDAINVERLDETIQVKRKI